MKKNGLLILLFVSFVSQVVYATDGSLKIDTNVQTPTEQRDISYIEQDSDFVILFQQDVSERIKELQNQVVDEADGLKNQIFTTNIEKVDTIKTYQNILFQPNQSVSLNQDSRVTLREAQKTITWQMVVMVCVASLVMGWSIINFFKRNKKKIWKSM